MFSKSVHKWNSVDVSNVGNGRFLTRGIVVDRTQTGFLVDFGIANKNPELIAFDRIIRDDEPVNMPTCACSKYSSICEVLLQLSAEQPWMWYKAWKLVGSTDSFVLVNADISSCRSITDIVRPTQVRCCAKNGRAVLFSDYIKEHVSNVPHEDFVVTPSFRRLWIGKKYLARTYPIGIVDKTFCYIQRRHDDGLDPSTVINLIAEIMKESTTSTTNNRGLKRSHEESEDENTVHHRSMESELAISDIPFDVLHGVLSHLDTVQLVRYRRVCPVWNSVITSMDLTKVVTCDMSTDKNPDAYVLAALLFKFITKTTTHLVFTRTGRKKESMEMSSSVWFRNCMEITKTIRDRNSITIPTLVLADLEIDSADLLDQSYSSKDGSRASIPWSVGRICQRFVLVRDTLLNLLDRDDDATAGQSPYRNFEISYATIRPVNNSYYDTKWGVRDALEPSARQFITTVVKSDLKQLRDWIKKVDENVSGNLLLQRKIIQVLETWEADDRRFGPTITWKDVQAAQLSNKLGTLHRITVMCLLCRKRQYGRVEEESSEDDEEEDEEEESDDDDDEDSDENSSTYKEQRDMLLMLWAMRR